jgi:hypothetical protein
MDSIRSIAPVHPATAKWKAFMASRFPGLADTEPLVAPMQLLLSSHEPRPTKGGKGQGATSTANTTPAFTPAAPVQLLLLPHQP